MNESISAWVPEAAKLPVAFAQVREDARIDLAITSLLGRDLNVMMVASGGCTSAALLSQQHMRSLHLVDCNPAQIALTRFKIELLQNEYSSRSLSILGHLPMSVANRKAAILSTLRRLKLEPDVFGPLDFVSEVGLDYCGRYERVFHELAQSLAPEQEALNALMRKSSPTRQAAAIAAGTELGSALDTAFNQEMSLANLVALFGKEATKNPVISFGEHFAGRTRHALETLPASSNPYLAQVLLGRFQGKAVYPWLTMRRSSELPAIKFHLSPMKDALLKATPGSLDFVHLSNILDWLSPAEAKETLDATHRALRSGGTVLIRQLNSSLDIPACATRFRWYREAAARLHAQDRSYFYRLLHLGCKR